MREMDGYRLLGKSIAVEWSKSAQRGMNGGGSTRDRDACHNCGTTGD
jgi:hypothetical protein